MIIWDYSILSKMAVRCTKFIICPFLLIIAINYSDDVVFFIYYVIANSLSLQLLLNKPKSYCILLCIVRVDLKLGILKRFVDFIIRNLRVGFNRIMFYVYYYKNHQISSRIFYFNNNNLFIYCPKCLLF